MHFRSLSLALLGGVVLSAPATVASDLRPADATWTDGAEAARAEDIIRVMVDARQSDRLIAPPSVTHNLRDIGLAYRIQRVFAARMRPLVGPVVGFKVAFASEAAQRQFGIDEPAYGPLFLAQRIPSGTTIPATIFRNIYMETEVAFTLDRAIDGEDRAGLESVEDLRQYVRSVHAAFDVGDGRFDLEAGSPGVADQVASGCAAHIFVLGPAMAPAMVDLDSVTLVLRRNGDTIRESPATEVMGNPWNSLLWLVRRVLQNGGRLEPGDVVVTGTAAPGFNATGDDLLGDYVGDCGPLGEVAIRIE